MRCRAGHRGGRCADIAVAVEHVEVILGADASFRKEERVKDGKKGTADYEAEGRAVAAKTVRLRALRLAKQAADKVEEAAKPVNPATQKRSIRPLP
jgi:hypothetical protein